MKLLALDSSGLVASAAIVDDNITIAEYTVNYKKTHSQTLLPMLDEIKRMTELDLHTIDAIAIAAGPGSFTGLADWCGDSKGIRACAGNSHYPSAHSRFPGIQSLWQRQTDMSDYGCPQNQVYTGLYTFRERHRGSSGYEMHVLQKQCAVDLQKLRSKSMRWVWK